MQFPLRHPQVVSVVAGMRGADQARETVERLTAPLPDDLWRALGDAGHIRIVGGLVSTITGVEVHDLRFPTSVTADGSDAMNQDADYSAAYVVLTTDEPADGAPLRGHGFTFTIGRGNELCAAAARIYADRLIGRDVADVVGDLGGTYRLLASDSQLRWLGPEKGVVHLAMAAVMNAVWDLAARRAGVPLWKYLVDLPAETLVDTLDLRYLSDELTRDEAIAMLRASEPLRAARAAELEAAGGYPCYTTSAGWLGYDDEKMVRLLREAVDEGYSHVNGFAQQPGPSCRRRSRATGTRPCSRGMQPPAASSSAARAARGRLARATSRSPHRVSSSER